MTEKLLQYIWRTQLFNGASLITEQGEPLRIINRGSFNTNQGPDFLNGKLMIGQILWTGHIELHLKTSDWQKHAHQKDDNYRNVILHVVWENDKEETDLFNLPTLELGPRVSKSLLDRYSNLMRKEAFVPCENSLKTLPPLIWSNWEERMLIERLQRKTADIERMLQENKNHWEETFWWLIARNFGLKVNAEAFEQIARSVPLVLLARLKLRIHQVEALLLGQAGLLNSRFKEAYPVMLQREYKFLQRKYNLSPVLMPLLFLRMRPFNFPSVRLAQLAMLIASSSHLFSRVTESSDIKEIKALLRVTANDYWHYHFRLDEPSAFRPKCLGTDMIHNILINTVIPVLYCYGVRNQDPISIEKALHWAAQLPAENNRILRGWKQLGVRPATAAESQALIELKTFYCDNRRCLDCAVGSALLRST